MGKLIRSKIAERIRQRGDAVPVHVMGNTEFQNALFDKVYEEADEILASDGKDANEFGDLLEVLMTLAEHNGIPWNQVEACRQAKKAELGGFDERLYASFSGGHSVSSVRRLIARGDASKAFPTVYARLTASDARRLTLALAQIPARPFPPSDTLPIVVIDGIIDKFWRMILREYKKRDTDIHTRWVLNKAGTVSLATMQQFPEILAVARQDGAGGCTINHLSAICQEIIPLAVILHGKREDNGHV